MFYCYDCGEYFEEPKTLYDGHSELDEGPVWEAYGACPYCESDQIDEAGICELCEEYTKPGRDICDICFAEISLLTDTVNRLVKKRADRYRLKYPELLYYVLDRLEE